MVLAHSSAPAAPKLTARLAPVARHATSPRERWSSTSHPASRPSRRPASSSSRSISKPAARGCALAAYQPFPPALPPCLPGWPPGSLPLGSRCLLPTTPRHAPQVWRVLVLALQQPKGCLWCGSGPPDPIRRVRRRHTLCAASAAPYPHARSPTDTSAPGVGVRVWYPNSNPTHTQANTLPASQPRTPN